MIKPQINRIKNIGDYKHQNEPRGIIVIKIIARTHFIEIHSSLIKNHLVI